MTPAAEAGTAAAGIDARGVLDLLDSLDSTPGLEMHSIAIAHAGAVVAEGYWAPYSADRVHLLYSISKTWTATAVGLLVDDGRLALDDPIIDLLPGVGDLRIAARWRQVTVGHCLRMATGHHTEAWGAAQVGAAGEPASINDLDPVVASILSHEPEHEPGTHFAYNQVATYLAAAAARAVCGQSVVDLLRDRVLIPLDVAELPWTRTATGAEIGFSGSHARTRDILALAQLYLDNGRHGGRQILSPEWVATAMASTGLPNPEGETIDWRLGYGCSFWTSQHGVRGDGAYGQFALVLPDQRIAIAITSETEQMQPVLDAVWRHLIPAVDRAGSSAADADLAARLRHLAVEAPLGAGPVTERTWQRAAGNVTSAYTGARLRPGAGGIHTLSLVRGEAVLETLVGESDWAESEWTDGDAALPVLARGGPTREGGYAADLRIIETPHTVQVRVAPGSEGVDLSWRNPPLNGTDPLWLAVRTRIPRIDT